MIFRISKNIPVPEVSTARRQGRHSSFAETLGKLEVGESFTVPINSTRLNLTVRSSAYQYGQRHGKRYATHVIKGDKIRIWRIK